jgi:hypothetical protein
VGTSSDLNFLRCPTNILGVSMFLSVATPFPVRTVCCSGCRTVAPLVSHLAPVALGPVDCFSQAAYPDTRGRLHTPCNHPARLNPS